MMVPRGVFEVRWLWTRRVGKTPYKETIEKNCGEVWDEWEILRKKSERLDKQKRQEAFEDIFTHTLFLFAQVKKSALLTSHAVGRDS